PCWDLPARLETRRSDGPAEQFRRFRRSALLDIDPGLLKMWTPVGWSSPARHDLYFPIGETVGTPAARFPSCGVEWHYTPPPVYLPEWPSASAPANAAYTTVAHWWGGRIPFGRMIISEEKRDSFLEYLDLPSRVLPALELALTLGDAAERERKLWAEHGWRIQDSMISPPHPSNIVRIFSSHAVNSVAPSRPACSCRMPG